MWFRRCSRGIRQLSDPEPLGLWAFGGGLADPTVKADKAELVRDSAPTSFRDLRSLWRFSRPFKAGSGRVQHAASREVLWDYGMQRNAAEWPTLLHVP